MAREALRTRRRWTSFQKFNLVLEAGSDYIKTLCPKQHYWTLISTPTVLLIRSAKRSTWGLPPFRVGIETTRGSSISFLLFPSLSFIQSKTGSVTITKDTSCFALISSKVFTASSRDSTTHVFLTPPSLK